MWYYASIRIIEEREIKVEGEEESREEGNGKTKMENRGEIETLLRDYRLLALDFKVSKTGRGVCRPPFDEAETGNFEWSAVTQN